MSSALSHNPPPPQTFSCICMAKLLPCPKVSHAKIHALQHRTPAIQTPSSSFARRKELLHATHAQPKTRMTNRACLPMRRALKRYVETVVIHNSTAGIGQFVCLRLAPTSHWEGQLATRLCASVLDTSPQSPSYFSTHILIPFHTHLEFAGNSSS